MDYYVSSPLIFLLRILESFSVFYLVLTISNSKLSTKKFLLGTSLLTITFELIKIITPQYLTAFLASSLSIFILIFICKINYKKVIISFLITSVSIAIVDCIVSLFIIKTSNLSTFSEISSLEA